MSEVTYSKTRHQCPVPPQRRQELQRLQKKDLSNYQHEGLSTSSSSWKVLAVILGIICLALIASAGFLATKLIQNSHNAKRYPGNISCNKEGNKKVNRNSIDADGHPGNISCNLEAYKKDWKYPACSANWYQHGINCYFFSRMTLLWNKCPEYCTGLKSSFVKVETKEEMNFLMEFSKMQCEMLKEKYLLSLSYNSQRKKWVWLDGTDHTPDTFYIPTIKNANNKCLHVKNGWINAEDCKISGYCICKKTMYSDLKTT